LCFILQPAYLFFPTPAIMDMMADPGAAVKGIADKLQEQVKESGLDVAEQFVGQLEALKEKAQAGPGDLMDKVKGAMDDFKKKVQDALDNPSSLAPGPLVACATWYGNAVVAKLKGLMEKVEELFKMLVKVIHDMAEPFKNLGDTMASAMEGIQGTLKGLTGLPNTVMALADTVKGPNDLKDVDTASMKNDLDTSGLSGPLDALSGLKDSMGEVVKKLADGVGNLTDFVGEAPDTIKTAFSVPKPLCCATPVIMKQAPAAFTNMMEQVDILKQFDMKPLLDMLKELADKLGNLDTEAVKAPVAKFAEMAGGQVDALDKLVSGAKMAGGIGEMGGLAPKGGCF